MHERLLHSFAEASEADRGAVYTRKEVVDCILDLAGYRAEIALTEHTLLEPCCGKGDFLLPAVERLLQSYWQRGGSAGAALHELQNAVCAVEINPRSCAFVSLKLTRLLTAEGIAAADAAQLVEKWLHLGDFLLIELPKGFDFIVGNPPYVRQERIPNDLLALYRRRYRTLYDRADLYVPFIERSLQLLRANGRLGFICSDRWMKNRYGGPLRSMVSQGFYLQSLVNVNAVDAFTEEVIAYPAIFVIENAFRHAATMVARPPASIGEMQTISDAMMTGDAGEPPLFVERHGLVAGSEPWLVGSIADTALLHRLEAQYSTLEEAGCRVGIGVATGADAVFIGPYDSLAVEDERKLPLVQTRDIRHGRICSHGLGVINPFEPDGTVAELDRYPRFARWVQENEAVLRRRNVAQRSGAAWYRTIDRIYPALVYSPKLLIPDIKGEANVVYDEGHFYPHHNLYFVTSGSWNLHALQSVLRSRLVRFVIAAYSLKMQGGYLRFQAQYLRRIRLPKWEDVGANLQWRLETAARAEDWVLAEAATQELFELTPEELATLNLIS